MVSFLFSWDDYNNQKIFFPSFNICLPYVTINCPRAFLKPLISLSLLYHPIRQETGHYFSHLKKTKQTKKRFLSPPITSFLCYPFQLLFKKVLSVGCQQCLSSHYLKCTKSYKDFTPVYQNCSASHQRLP